MARTERDVDVECSRRLGALNALASRIVSDFGSMLHLTRKTTAEEAAVAVDGAAMATHAEDMVAAVEELLALIRAVKADAITLSLSKSEGSKLPL